MTSKRSSLLGALIESFFTQRLIRQRRASPATISAYKDALRLLLGFVASRLGKHIDCLNIQDLDYEAVLAFLDFLERERGNSARTRNARWLPSSLFSDTSLTAIPRQWRLLSVFVVSAPSAW